MLQNDLLDHASPSTFIDAERSVRLANFLIDMVAVIVLHFIVTMLLLTTLDEQNILRHPAGHVGVFVTVYVLYYLISEGMTQRTFGKMLSNTRVISQGGRTPKGTRVLIRTLCRLIPLEPLSFMLGFNWHDRFSKTRVICL